MSGLLDFFGKKQAVAPFSYRLECIVHPLRIASHSNDYSQLEVSLTNICDQELLSSLIIQLPKTLGLDQTGLSHERELRLGMLKPGETSKHIFNIYASRATPGDYKVGVFAAAHYRDYGHILNQTRKIVDVRVV